MDCVWVWREAHFTVPTIDQRALRYRRKKKNGCRTARWPSQAGPVDIERAEDKTEVLEDFHQPPPEFNVLKREELETLVGELARLTSSSPAR
jgi:hypothetical protein